jgi:threonine dehydrogenase-like Zn-dependent dehydrogenase
MTRGTSQAAVKVASNTTELRTFDLPDLEKHPEGGLLRVEATGVCGADVMWYPRVGEPRTEPTILGHHVVGVIEELSDRAAYGLSLAVGDRILIEEYLPCGVCVLCREGKYRMCPTTTVWDENAIRYGSTTVSREPSLWGGFSEYLFLHERSVAHKLAPSTSTEQATLILPLSNGIQWIQRDSGVEPGGTVVIVGPGQHGLTCVVAAQQMGVGNIIVMGLPGDEHRLEIARTLGAHYTVTDSEEALRIVRDVTNGRMADAVLDLAAGTPGVADFALQALGIEGTLLMAVWPDDPTPIPLLKMAIKKITIKPVRGHSFEAVDAARRLVESGRVDLDILCTGSVGLGDVHQVLMDLQNPDVRGEMIHMSVDPWR